MSTNAFDFQVDVEEAGDGVAIVAVQGEVDLFTAPELKAAAQKAIDGGTRRLVIDLSATRFLDSTALGVLIGLVKRVRPDGGDVAVVNTEPTTAKTFSITGLDEVFTIVATRDDALDALRSA